MKANSDYSPVASIPVALHMFAKFNAPILLSEAQ